MVRAATRTAGSVVAKRGSDESGGVPGGLRGLYEGLASVGSLYGERSADEVVAVGEGRWGKKRSSVGDDTG